jgi:uncharacterized protein (TIGR00297 family)
VQLAFGAALAAAVALAARAARSLTLGGAVAAFAIGTAVFGAAGWRGAAVLFAFFIPSVLLSRAGRARKRPIGDDVGKQGARDGWQVLANGGVAAACALFTFHEPVLAAAFAGAFAAASADTWGTEIGTLAKAPPRSILTLRPMARGLSGGVTAVGTLATLAGAAAVAAVAASTGVAPFWPVAAGGFAGALTDSLLGASVQAMRWCPACARACENDPHACGTPTVLRRGARWMENDAVNFAATLSGAIVAAFLARGLG